MSIAITARGLYDYQRMFNLDDSALVSETFLDCAAGASSFGAQVRLRGGHVISVDPAYSGSGIDMEARVRRNLDNSRDWFASHNKAINWDYLGTPEAYIRATDAILDLFKQDFTEHRTSYIADSLPKLSSFEDNSIGTCLCSNFLFAYSELMTAEDLAASILELTRIARNRTLIHPMGDRLGRDITHLIGAVAKILHDHGRTVTVVDAPASWLIGAQTMHVIKAN